MQAALYVATGRELPENTKLMAYYLTTRLPEAAQVFQDEYGLWEEDAETLARAGDSVWRPSESEGGDARLLPENYAWPEKDIVEALLDKVDELEAKERLP